MLSNNRLGTPFKYHSNLIAFMTDATLMIVPSILFQVYSQYTDKSQVICNLLCIDQQQREQKIDT